MLFVLNWRAARPYNDGTWARVRKTGVLRIGMDASYPPFSDTPDGVPVGLDVDIANEIGRRLGVKVQIMNLGFDGLYDALGKDQVDVLISALSFDPTKIDRVLYTTSYIDAGQVILSRDGSISQMQALDGHSVAVEYGSGGDEVARVWQRRLHNLTIIHYTLADDALNAALTGTADFALCDWVTTRLYIRKHPGLVIPSEMVTHDPYSVATRISSYDLAGAISEALHQMQQDGTLTAIIDRWL
jgi:polar amino acid transport system substrate-binding protein